MIKISKRKLWKILRVFLKQKNRFFLIGLVTGLIMAGLFIGLGAILSRKQNSIIAPYYEKEAFQKPADLSPPGISGNVKGMMVPVKFPIVTYHYVEYVADPADFIRKSLDVNPALFERQLKQLSQADYHSYFVRDIPDIFDGKISYDPKSIILTFDDGYEDFYTGAFPLLKKYQMKATIYIIVDKIGKTGYLTKAQIKELLASNLVEVGSHTLDHVYLKQAAAKTASKQILESKKQLEELFGIKIFSFAYPYGAFNQATVDLVKEAGYSAAVSVISGTMQSPDNQFFLSRIRAGKLMGVDAVKALENIKN